MEASCSQLCSPSEGPWKPGTGGGLEADLHRHLYACEKNPGHTPFIPVDQFNVEHLPFGCQDNDLVDVVRAVSDLTVRVTVTYVSESRPETVPGSDKPYPCYRDRGRSLMRVGTGFIWRVEKYSHEDNKDYKTCPCIECWNSFTPKTQFAYIYILTACHVVFDELEGAHTTCHLSFDRGSIPDLCSGVLTLHVMSCVWSDIKLDRQLMIHVTHDLDLSRKVDKMVARYECISEKIHKKYTPPIPSTRQKLTIIVAHPHACSKQVSVGYYKHKENSDDGFTKYIYTTASCPGSSGALVFVPGREMWQKRTSGLFHSGQCEDNDRLNYDQLNCSGYVVCA